MGLTRLHEGELWPAGCQRVGSSRHRLEANQILAGRRPDNGVVIPGLERQLEESEQKLSGNTGNHILKPEVDENDIAEIISLWTHIPVAKLLQGERDKLLTLETVLKQRVVAQDPDGFRDAWARARR